MRSRALPLLVVLLVLFSSRAAAQEEVRRAPLLTPGERVRVTFLPAPPVMVVGRLGFVAADTMQVSYGDPASDPYRIPLASITSLEVYRGRGAAGPVLGALAGVLLSIPAGALAAAASDCEGVSSCSSPKYLAAGVIGGGVGFLIGSGISGRTAWRRIDVAELRTTVDPPAARP